MDRAEDAVGSFARLLVPSAAFLAGDCPLPSPPAAASRSALAAQARTTAKLLLDDALRREDDSVPLMQALIRAFEANKPATRAQKAKKKQDVVELAYTPLQQLYVGAEGEGEGMSDEAVWAQMMERVKAVRGWMEPLLGTGEGDDDDDDAIAERKKAALGLDESDSDEDEEDEDDSSFGLGLDDEDMDVDPGLEGSDDEDDFAEGPSYSKPLNDLAPSPKRTAPDDVDDFSLDTIDSRPSRRRGKDGSTVRKGKSPVDEGFFSLAEFEAEADEGERQMAKRVRQGRAEDDDDEDDSDEEEEDVDLFAPIENREEGEDEDEDEEEGGVDLDDVADLKYADFFDPPPRAAKSSLRLNGTSSPAKAGAEADRPKPRKGRVSFADSVTVRDIPSANRGMNVAEMMKQAKMRTALLGGADGDEEDGDAMEWASELLDSDSGSDSEDDQEEDGEDDEEDDDEMDEDLSDSGDERDAGGRTMSRIDSDLFDSASDASSPTSDDEDRDAPAASNLSRYERRQQALAKRIADLEAKSVAKKHWTMSGEAGARDRPQNSLLEQDLDFEHIGKTVPLVTEEKTGTLEELIKRRVLENDFDDVVRRRPVDMKAFLPSRFLELQDTQSSKSLAEVYADSYRDVKARSEGQTVVDPRDSKLENAHAEITDLYETLCGQLDALSNAHFTPKAPKATISTVSNLPAVTMESALPTSSSTANLLAPEEVHAADPRAVQRDRSGLSHRQKQAERQARKKARSSLSKLTAKASGLGVGSGGARKKGGKSVKEQKEESAKRLLGTKGVTVIGKEGKGKGKQAKAAVGASALKL